MSGSSLRELPAAERTLPRLLERQATRYGAKPLVRDDAGVRSYVELRDRAAAVAGSLAAAGVGRGDTVALMAENRLEVLELWLGCAWLGAVLAPLNTALRGPALEHALTLSGARLLVLEPALLERLEHVGDVQARRRIWLLDGTASESAGYESYPGPGTPLEAAPVGPGAAAALLLTSGTTGPSKAVVCPHGQWFWWGVVVGELLGIREEDLLYTNLPLFHTNALAAFCQALVHGATLAVGPRFSGSRFWQRVSEAEATVSYLLGTMVHLLVKQDSGPYDRAHRLRVVLAPGTKAEVWAEFRRRYGVEIVDAWGSTEANAAIASAGTDGPLGTMGRVVEGFEGRVVDEGDVDVPDGVPGELVLRSRLPFAFASGYHGMPQATVAAWRNLWLHTGDRVVRRDGVYTFVDRMNDAIRRRGENISAWEVEQTLLTHPDVLGAAVVGVPAELGEDEVMAFVVARPGRRPHLGDLVAFCRPRLAAFAVPRYVELVDELPLTASGRVEKYRLRERGVTASTWDREAADLGATA
jgi:crotonobetaine/carnitine-CoA ligase